MRCSTACATCRPPTTRPLWSACPRTTWSTTTRRCAIPWVRSARNFRRRSTSSFASKTPMQRLDMALKRLGIKMLGVVSDALAAPESVLLPDEKEEGVAVVDVGGGVTDVTVYYRNVVRYVASIPMGASAINRDIRTMSVPEKHVESLKQKYGSAVAELAPEDKLIRVNGRTAREAKRHSAAQPGHGDRGPRHGHREFVQQEIKFGLRRETGLRHRADGRFGQTEGPRRTVPPRDGHGRACRCARDGNHRGVEGEGCGRRFLDRGHPAQGGELGGCAKSRSTRSLVPKAAPGLSRRRSPQRAGSRLRSSPLLRPIRLPCRLRNPIPGCRPEPNRPDGRTKRAPPSRRWSNPSAPATGVRSSRRPSTKSIRVSRPPRTRRFLG